MYLLISNTSPMPSAAKNIKKGLGINARKTKIMHLSTTNANRLNGDGIYIEYVEDCSLGSVISKIGSVSAEFTPN